MFKAIDSEAVSFSQCMLDYLNKKVLEHISQDAAPNDPDVELSDYSEDEGGGAASPAMKVKKRCKMKQSERDARQNKKVKGNGKGPDANQ